MDLVQGKQPAGDELLKAQAHLWKHIFSFINSMALKCAIQLGIPDALSRHGCHPITISDLVSALQIDVAKTQFIYRFMRLLVHSGFFKMQKVNKDDDGKEGYVLTDSSRLLLKDSPLTATPFLLPMLDPLLLEPWQYLSAWFRNDDTTPFQTAHGLKVWEYFGSKQKDSDIFNEAMASDSRLVATILVDKYKCVFEGLDSLVDVAGGTGTMAKAIAEAFPEMKCTVFDLPHVVADVKETENFKVFGGNMFEAIPPTDAVLLKWILHDWSDEECLKLLRKCKEAITSKSNGKKRKVMIIDMVVGNQTRDEEEENQYPIETELQFDVMMMTVLGGRERNEKEWVKLFQDAEFTNYKIYPILGLRSLIEIYP